MSLDPHCVAFDRAVTLLARPWTALLLTLLQPGPRRFTELEADARTIGAKTLSARLKELEARGLVTRRIEAGPPVQVRYQLTARGRAFRRVAAALERWGRTLE